MVASLRGVLSKTPRLAYVLIIWVLITRILLYHAEAVGAPEGWLRPRGPEGQQGPAPLPLQARDKELINQAEQGVLYSY